MGRSAICETVGQRLAFHARTARADAQGNRVNVSFPTTWRRKARQVSRCASTCRPGETR